MIKKILLTAAIAAGASLFAAGSVYAVGAIAENNAIGNEAAERLAIVDAEAVNAENLSSKFKFENGHYIYDVEFTADGVEYDYDINAKNGTVIKKESKAVSKPSKPGEKTGAKDGTKTEAPTSADNGTKTDVQDDEKNNAATSSNTGARTPNSEASSVSAEEALSKALSDLGIEKTAVTRLVNRRDHEDGVEVYDIEFVYNGTEYEYTVNAKTGAIFKKSTEPLGTSSDPVLSAAISLDDAKAIALRDAGISHESAVFTVAKEDIEDGRAVYELEFSSGNRDYEYEIAASNGRILDSQVNTVYEEKAAGISLNEAKQIALTHAGKNETGVTFTEAARKIDDGRTVYELEFYTDTAEYEYEISAADGRILDASSEPVNRRQLEPDKGRGINDNKTNTGNRRDYDDDDDDDDDDDRDDRDDDDDDDD